MGDERVLWRSLLVLLADFFAELIPLDRKLIENYAFDEVELVVEELSVVGVCDFAWISSVFQ